MKFNTKLLTFSGLTIALIILLTYVFAFNSTFIRLTFAFLPLSLYAMRFGPKYAAVVAMLADVIGSNLFFPGLYFPGFTLSAGLAGLIYGYFLHNKPLKLKNCLYALIIIFILNELILTTVWLSILYHKGALFVLSQRTLAKIIFLPVKGYLMFQFLKVFQKVKL